MRIPRLLYGAMIPAAAGLLVACTTPAPQTTARGTQPAHAPSAETTTAAAATGPAAAPAAASAGGAAPAAAAAAAGGTDMAHAKTTFQTVCSACHDAALATDLRNTRRGWEQVVDRMFGFGMSATDAQVKEIVDYLTATYPAA